MSKQLQHEIKQTKPFEGPEHEAFLSIGRTWAVLEHAFAEQLESYGITPTQYNVLRILRGAGKEGLCRKDIWERMITNVPDVTRLLDRMEANGLIRRERDPSDRRFVTARITDQGLRLLAELDELVQEQHVRCFQELEEEQLRTLIELLAKVRNFA